MDKLAFFLVLTSLLAMAQSVLVIRQVFPQDDPLKVMPEKLGQVWDECNGTRNNLDTCWKDVRSGMMRCSDEVEKFSFGVPVANYSDSSNNPFKNFEFDFAIDDLVKDLTDCIRGQDLNWCRQCLDSTTEFGSQITVVVEPLHLESWASGYGQYWDTVEEIEKCTCNNNFQAGMKNCLMSASTTLIFQAHEYLEDETDLTHDIIDNLRKPVDDLKSCLKTEIGKLEGSCKSCLPDDAKIPEKLIVLSFKTFYF